MKVKKIGLFILLTITMLLISLPVKAASSYSVELVGASTVEKGEEIQISIKVKDIVDISEGIAGLSVKLEYDESKLDKKGATEALNGFMVVEGNTIELAKYPGVTGDTEVAKITFKVKDTASRSTWIKLTGIEAADGTNIYPLLKEVKKEITIKGEVVEDTTAPVGTIEYITNADKSVTAKITFNEENVTITNNEGKDTYVFTKNGEFTFEFKDAAGNAGSAKAIVSDIKVEEPEKEDPKPEQPSDKEDNTTVPDKEDTKLPQTGAETASVIAIVALGVVSIVSLVAYRRYKDI